MNIIFVCTGNTCRSPMAEGYLKSKNIEGLTVISRGVLADGSPISQNSEISMGEIGINLSGHISKQISIEDINWADKIICLSNSHKEMLMQFNEGDKISVLSNGISDPFGLSLEIYRKCRDEIVDAIDQLIDKDFFSKIEIIKSQENDIAAIAELEKVCFSEPWSESVILESMKSGTCFFTAFHNGKIAGYIGVNCVLDEGYITNIAVFPEFRRRGIATALLDRCMELSKEKNLAFISLEVRESNKSAIKLYEKFGFKKDGLRKKFYKNPIEDGLIFTKRFENNENT